MKEPDARPQSHARVAQQALTLELLQGRRNTSDPQAMMQAAAEAIGLYLHVDRVGFFEMRGNTLEFSTGWTAGRLPLLTGSMPAEWIGTGYLAEVRLGKTLGISDVRIDPLTLDSQFTAIGTLSLIGVPIIRDGEWHAGFYVDHSEVRHWTPEEVTLVRDVGEQTWDAVERARAQHALKKSDERLTLALEAGGGTGTWDWDIPLDRVYSDARFAHMFGVDAASAAAGLPLSTFIGGIHPEDRTRVQREIQFVLDSGDDFSTEYRVSPKDGIVRWLHAQGRCRRDPAGNPIRFPGVAFDITQRKVADEHLRQQWKTFDAALSNTPDFTYVFDLEGHFTYANRALLSLWQRSYEDSIGRDFIELGYPPELADRLHRQIQQVIQTNGPVRDQTPFTGPTGETRQYEYIFVPIRNEDGTVEAVAGSTRDITERLEAEEVLRRDSSRWRDLLLQTPAAIAVLRGPDFRFEWVNLDYARLVGRSSASLIGKTVLEAVPEVEGQMYLGLLNNVYQTGQPFTGREALLKLDGGDGVLQDVYINFVYVPTRDLSGVIDGIFVHATDVTDMVVARRHLEESEQQFRTLAETIPHLAWMADHTGHIFWYNKRWYDYTGTTFQEMEGWGWESAHHPEYLPLVTVEWRAALASGQPFEMVSPLKGADGSFRSFLTRVEPVKDAQGRVVRWFGTNTDITEQRRTEEQLRKMNRELEEFAYVASHDLQEPLRMVNIYTQLILKQLSPEDAVANQYAAFVRTGVERMEVLIRDLLTFSRTVHAVHNDGQPLGSADLSASLSEAMAVLKNRIDESGATITAHALPTVQGDHRQLAHVFQNLISNSLKYRHPDRAPEISISAVHQGHQWQISVTDNGIGFEQEYAERIFGLFKRLHKEEYPGTGLGLAICQRIVERCGGRIWAESRPGHGSSFFFTLSEPETH